MCSIRITLIRSQVQFFFISKFVIVLHNETDLLIKVVENEFGIADLCIWLMFICIEDKAEQPELPKYRDRAKEQRDDQNPDYEANELGSFHAVAPPGNVDLGSVT